MEVGRVDAGENLAVRPVLDVTGDIEFVADADVAPTSVTATLVIAASTGSRIEVPILFVIGELQVEFLENPVITLRGLEVLRSATSDQES